MKLTQGFVALLIAGFAVTGAYAQASDGGTCPGKCAGTTSVSTDDSGGCPITAAMENLPKITFQVGTEATCCSQSAESLAKKHGLPVKFVVSEKTFDDKEQAFTALVEQTESFVNTFTSPKTCEVSGTTSIAGKSCDCPIQAGKNTEVVKAAVEKIKMSYAVGDETCDCPNKAASLAKSTGENTEFVVNGEKTSCQLTARLNLARAKYKAAVQAITAIDANKSAQQPAEKEGDS